jgi:hypothetical protein
MKQPRVHSSSLQSCSTQWRGVAARGPNRTRISSRTVRRRRSGSIRASMRASGPMAKAFRMPGGGCGPHASIVIGTGEPRASERPFVPSARQKGSS